MSDQLLRRGRPARRWSQLELTAYHEAGHAVACLRAGRALELLSIVPAGDDVGLCRAWAPAWLGRRAPETPAERAWASNYILCCLAGVAAELELAGAYDHRAAGEDFARARRHAVSLVGEGAAAGLVAALLGEARDLVRERWPAVEALAAELLVAGLLDGPEAARVVALALSR